MRKERLKFLFQGILLIILAIVFMSNPIRQGALFLMIIGIICILIGLVIIVDGIFVTKELKYRILRVLEGILFGGFGLIFFLRNPARGAFLVVTLVVLMMMILAVMNTIAIFKSENNLKWVAVTLNILVIWFGIQSLQDPQLAILIFYWTVSFQLISTGVNHIMLYFLIEDVEGYS